MFQSSLKEAIPQTKELNDDDLNKYCEDNIKEEDKELSKSIQNN